MNITLFKTTLRKEALSCYNKVLDSYNNSPFGEQGLIILSDVIEFEMNQSLGKKAYAAVMTSNLSQEQLKIMTSLVQDYKKRIERKLLE